MEWEDVSMKNIANIEKHKGLKPFFQTQGALAQWALEKMHGEYLIRPEKEVQSVSQRKKKRR